MSAVDLTPEQISARFADIADVADRSAVRCQCDQHGAPCPAAAEFTVELHVLGDCKGSEANQYGNRVELLCQLCVHHLWNEAALRVTQLRAAAQLVGMLPHCGSCMCPISGPSDLLRAAKRTDGGIR